MSHTRFEGSAVAMSRVAYHPFGIQGSHDIEVRTHRRLQPGQQPHLVGRQRRIGQPRNRRRQPQTGRLAEASYRLETQGKE